MRFLSKEMSLRLDTPAGFASRSPPSFHSFTSDSTWTHKETSGSQVGFSAFQPCAFPWMDYPGMDYPGISWQPLSDSSAATTTPVPQHRPFLPACPTAFVPLSCSQTPHHLLGFHELTQETLPLISLFPIPCIPRPETENSEPRRQQRAGVCRGWSCLCPSSGKNQNPFPGIGGMQETPPVLGRARRRMKMPRGRLWKRCPAQKAAGQFGIPAEGMGQEGKEPDRGWGAWRAAEKGAAGRGSPGAAPGETGGDGGGGTAASPVGPGSGAGRDPGGSHERRREAPGRVGEGRSGAGGGDAARGT